MWYDSVSTLINKDPVTATVYTLVHFECAGCVPDECRSYFGSKNWHIEDNGCMPLFLEYELVHHFHQEVEFASLEVWNKQAEQGLG